MPANTRNDITNDERAAAAEHALLEYAVFKEGGDELSDEFDTVMTDLLTDLMHLAQSRGRLFMSLEEVARANFKSELENLS